MPNPWDKYAEKEKHGNPWDRYAKKTSTDTPSLTANSIDPKTGQGYGTYRMLPTSILSQGYTDASKEIKVPYNRVKDAITAGYDLHPDDKAVYEKDSTILATAPDTTASFVPSAIQWRTDSIPLTAYLGSHIQLAFDNIGHYGQNLYIDNINIVVSPDAVKQIVQAGDLNIFPNPAKDRVTIKATGVNAGNATIVCYSENGTIVNRMAETLHSGELNTSINTSRFAPGVYELVIQYDNGSTATRQLVIQ